jgi:hypothetical protein
MQDSSSAATTTPALTATATTTDDEDLEALDLRVRREGAGPGSEPVEPVADAARSVRGHRSTRRGHARRAIG